MKRFGATILAVFATIWWFIGVYRSHASTPLAYAVGILISLAIVVGASRGPRETLPQEERERRGRLTGMASAVEGIVIFVAINVLINLGKAEYIVPVIAIIVGLHFLPLAHGIPVRMYYGTAAALIALGAVGCLPMSSERRTMIVGLGSAAILWITATLVLVGRGTGSENPITRTST